MTSTTSGVIGGTTYHQPAINVEGELPADSSPKTYYKGATRKVKFDTGTFDTGSEARQGMKEMQVAPKVTTAEATLNQSKQEHLKESKAKAATAAANFVIDVFNADAAYGAAKGQAAQNIMAARMQHADTLFLGREAQLQAQSEGYNAGQDATLAMAAQGQDVQGAGVQKVQGSYEAMGIENGMKQYNNAIREALGYEIEEINTNAQLKSAKIARDYSIIGSALTNGTTAGMAMM